ncbi:MAG: amidase, partial [Chloroflexi bacterium]|nr:amidase [Chloroflexota bacterium]
MDELIYKSAKSIAKAIRNKEVSSAEVVDAFLKRIEEVNPKINAVVQLAADRARTEAREADEALSRGESKGPLHGVPITLKDSLDTEGIITTGGTKGRESFVPEQDATVTARLRGAGAILMGKTNTPELTFAGETSNLIYGRTNNPYDLSRMPGGSSGGAGAIIASGGSPLDMGSDTGGSVRLPAHFCGIAGIKPTSGRVPRTGHIIPFGMGAVDSLTQIGPMARYVEDLALALPIISGPDWRDPAIVPMPLGDPDAVDLKSLRVAVHTDNGLMTPTPETIEAVTAAAKALSDAGVTVEEDCPAALQQIPDIKARLNSADGTRRLLEKAGTTEIHPWLQRWFDRVEVVPTADYTALLEKVDAYRSEMLGFMEAYDAILCPTCAFPATEHEGSFDESLRNGFTYSGAYNVTGWPGAVVRGGTSPEGLPIG